MRNFLWTLLILGVFILASLVSVDGAPGATQTHRCFVHGFFALSSSQEEYFATSARVSDRTSCAFARNVFKSSMKFIIRAGGQGDGDFYVRAYSPTTHKNYKVHCWADGMLTVLMHVDCRAGHGAHVTYNVWEAG
jgi:hypothetical protein